MILPSTVESLPDLLALQVSRNPSREAFRFRSSGGPWQAVSWMQFGAGVEDLAATLGRSGVSQGQRVGILGANGLAWELSQHAILALGGTVVGLDPLYPPGTLTAVMAACNLDGLIALEVDAFERLPGEAREHAGTLMHAKILIEPSGRIVSELHVTPDDRGMPGRRPCRPGSAIMVFSSGTTGTPKPIEYTHAQVLLAVREILACFPEMDREVPQLCWLPLPNLFQRVINFCALHEGMCSYLLEDPRQVIPALADVEPEIMIGVPIFFERVRSGMMERLEAAGPVVRRLASWALAGARAAAEAESSNRRPTVLQRVWRGVAEHIVLRRLRRVFGRRIRHLISGSAPLSKQTAIHFHSIGLPILEAYGVSENIVPIAMNRPAAARFGTVGRIMPRNEVRIDSGGEVHVRGPGVFSGYFNADADTPGPAEDGYWRTGDLGALDESGFLRIVGRLSEAFKLSTGKWVAPTDIESALRSVTWVDQVAVVGSGRKNPVAIISAPALRSALEEATLSGLEDAFGAGIAQELAAAAEALAGPIRPRGVLITLSAFSVAEGEMTSNLKLRRRVIEDRYESELSALFASLDAAEPASRPPCSTPLVRVLR